MCAQISDADVRWGEGVGGMVEEPSRWGGVIYTCNDYKKISKAIGHHMQVADVTRIRDRRRSRVGRDW